MSLFFFDVRSGDRIIRDEVGSNLRESEIADNAADILSMLARDAIGPDRCALDVVCEVYTEQGSLVYRSTLSLELLPFKLGHMHRSLPRRGSFGTRQV